MLVIDYLTTRYLARIDLVAAKLELVHLGLPECKLEAFHRSTNRPDDKHYTKQSDLQEIAPTLFRCLTKL